MNILDIEDTLKGIDDETLLQEAQAPSGSAPQYLVISEIQRRTDMRERYAAEQEQPQSTVSDQIVNKGIMALGGQSSPSPEMAGQQPMLQQDMTQQPMLQQAMPEQPVAPPQMMNVGGEVELGEGDDISMLLEELGGVSNKIPDDRERDLYITEFEDSVLSGFPSSIEGAFSERNLAQASIPNAILEDANKFRPEQMLGVDLEELAVFQDANADLPEVLGYAGGGIVELQEGGQPEDDPWWRERYFGDDDKFNWGTAALDASWLIPGGGLALGGARLATKLGIGGLKAYRSGALGRAWRGLPARGRQVVDPRVSPLTTRANPAIVRGEGFTMRDPSVPARLVSPYRLAGTGAAISGLHGIVGAFGDDDEAQAAAAAADGGADVDGDGVYDGGAGLVQADKGPEPGSLEWIQEERRKMYESGGGAREEKLQEILSRQREQGTLMQEQARSDMLSSALMNLGAGIAAGDPSEGLRLAANAVEGIRSSARQGAIAQQNMMDELELAGIDVDQAEKVALLAAMQDRISLEQRIRATGSAEVQNAIAVINAQAQTVLAQGHLQSPPVTRPMIDEMILRAMQLAMENPNQPAFYLQPFASGVDGASNGDFTVTEG